MIEGEDGLIVYNTSDNKEEGEPLREAITKISHKPIKAINYSHSRYTLGGGALVDNPNDVLVIGHPELNEMVQNSLQGGGAPSAIPEVGPVLTARGAIQFNNFLSPEGPDAAIAGRIESWSALYRGSTDLEQAVAAGKVKLGKGDQGELVGVFDLFDKLVSTRD